MNNRQTAGEVGDTEAPAERFRRIEERLNARHKALSAEIRQEQVHADDERAERVEQSTGERMEDIDKRVAERFRTLERADIERHVKELSEIEDALERLRDGRYGQCAVCGKDIGAQRLEVQPMAIRCVACQDQHEAAAGES